MNNTKKFGAFAVMVAAVVICACTAAADQTWSGKVEITSDVSDNLYIATTADAAAYQDGYVVTNWQANGYLGRNDHSAAYILRDGIFTGLQILRVDGRYLHFRQTGGNVGFQYLMHAASANTANTLPYDLVFGGSAYASPLFYKGDGSEFKECNMNIAVMDNADINAGLLRADGTGTNYIHVIALNGGLLTMSNRQGGRNVYYAFNGGTLQPRASDPGSYMFGENRAASGSQYDIWVRIYESGGRIIQRPTGLNNASYVYPAQIRKPEDNVVWSIPIPDGHELKTKVWDTPPSVLIVDSTGAGSNAVAVADWDFDSGYVTNVTVLCRGENYSACGADDASPTVTAKFRLSATDNLKLCPSVPVVTGPGVSGDFTFSAVGSGSGIAMRNATNTYCGATIVDMDIDRRWEHTEGVTTKSVEYLNSLMVYTTGNTRFLNTTSIVIRSGALWPSGAVSTQFPDVTRLELYGGHITTKTYSFPDVVVGGETWLCSYNTSGYPATLTVPADGTLTVDYGAVVTNDVIVTPKLKYGTVTFTNDTKIALNVRDWSKLPRGKKVPVLDLSGVTTFTTRDMATLLQPEDGKIAWGSGDDAKILYARRNADGMFLIFR